MQCRLTLLLLLLLCASCGSLRLFSEPQASPQDWTQLGGNPRRTYYSPTDLKAPLKILWEYSASAAVSPNAAPITVGNQLFIASRNGEVAALKTETGEEVSAGSVASSLESTPVIDGKFLFALDAYAYQPLIQFDLINGRAVQEKKYGNGFEASPLIVGEGFQKRIYAANLQGELVCIDRTGAEQFLFKTDERQLAPSMLGGDRTAKGAGYQIHSSPSLCGNTVVFGNDAGVLYGVDATSGKKVFRLELSSGAIYSAPCVDGDSAVYVTAANVGRSRTTGGALFKINVRNIAAPVIEKKIEFTSTVFAGAAVSPEFVVTGCSDRKLRCYRKSSMEPVWEVEAKAAFNTAALIAGETVYAGSLDRKLYAIDLRTGRVIQKLKLWGRIKSPLMIASGKLIVCSENNGVHALIHNPNPDTTTAQPDEENFEF